jgi:alkylation response protein AidB-like acyl-CoA dehydrogenase
VDIFPAPGELAFRDELRGWLGQVSVPDGLRDYGPTPAGPDLGPARRWQQLLHAGGWAALSWPQPHGRGASFAMQAIFAEELARRSLPRQLSFVTMEIAGPVIIGSGRPDQASAMLGPMARGELIWCQLFSEPGAGSDLAAVRTAAVPDGDGWVVSGQKIWTSGAHYADFGLLLARTDPAARRHHGLTCFALPMDRPGIEVRPIRQLDGEQKFNEVFLTGVPVERKDLLGEPGSGWRVALSVLGNERTMLGSQAIGLETSLRRLREQAEAAGLGDALFRDRWIALHNRVQQLRWTWFRYLSETDPARFAGRTSVLKLVSSELQQQVADLARLTFGPAWSGEPGHESWRHQLLISLGATIAGGTSEIQRNILAERVLGLPR